MTLVFLFKTNFFLVCLGTTSCKVVICLVERSHSFYKMSTSIGSDIVLWTIPEKFFISSEDFPSKILIIDRVTGQARVESYKHQIPSIVGRKSIAGLIGVINLVSGP